MLDAMVADERPVVVAGAGAAGLGAARELALGDHEVLLVEPHDRAGGLARGHDRGALRFKAGIHLLHPSSNALAPLVGELAALMAPRLHRIEPRAGIHFMGRRLAYPFRGQELLATLGPARAARALIDALGARAHAPLGAVGPDSFEAVVRRAYGDSFYELFFASYTARVLGRAPADIDGDWARRRVPMPSARSLAQTLLPWWRPPHVEHAHSPFLTAQLTGPRGLEPLFDGLLDAGGDRVSARYGWSVSGVHWSAGHVEAVTLRAPSGREERVDGARLISTMPLPELIEGLRPAAPEDVQRAAASLRCRGLVFTFLRIKRPRLFTEHWIYTQSAGLGFNRVSEFGNVVPGAFGPDQTLVCAEATGDPGEDPWDTPDDVLVARALAGLQKMAPDLEDGELEEGFVTRERHGYPSWTLGYRLPLRRALAFVDTIRGLETAGRQGRFDYLNLDEAVASGVAAARRLTASSR